jgi:hypothetical protein
MDDSSDTPDRTVSNAWLRVLRPAMPAVIGAAALVFLFAALMPMTWVAAISWNLYFDRLSDYFVPPVGNAARLLLALGMAAVAAILAGFVVLLIDSPEVAGLASLRDRFRRASGAVDDDTDDASWTRRRRVDLHPDDPVRPPIRAGRDLPAGGLGALGADGDRPDRTPDPVSVPEDDELILADLAHDDPEAGEEPWLQPAAMTTIPAPAPAPTDNSLGAMVARLEAGLARRRQSEGSAATADATAAPDAEVDVALEAALSTLQRMTRQSVG